MTVGIWFEFQNKGKCFSVFETEIRSVCCGRVGAYTGVLPGQ